MRYCTVCTHSVASCCCKTKLRGAKSEVSMWPLLDGSLQTRCRLQVLHLISHDRSVLRQLPVDLPEKLKLSSLLSQLLPVIRNDLIPNLYPALKDQKDIWKLRPFLHIKADGRPNLERSFWHLVLGGRDQLELQADAVLSLACEFYAVDIIRLYWMMLTIEERHTLITHDPFAHTLAFDVELLRTTLESDELQGLTEHTLILIFREPSCSAAGCSAFLRSIKAQQKKWLTKVLFGTPKCYLDTVQMSSPIYLPLAQALVSSFSTHKIVNWGLKTWSPMTQHLALWLELWPSLNFEQRTDLMVKWFTKETDEALIASCLFAQTMRELKHVEMIFDLIRTCPSDSHADHAMSVLTYAIAASNQPLLIKFFEWCPRRAHQEAWAELLMDFVRWNDEGEFSSYCILLKHSPKVYGYRLATRMIEQLLKKSLHTPEPRADQIELLWKYCKNKAKRQNFVDSLLEACLANSWSWEAFAWLWVNASPDVKNALQAISVSSRQRKTSQFQTFAPEYREIILSESLGESLPMDGAICLSKDLLWDLLKKGQPYLFCALWEGLLMPQERMAFREQFSRMSKSQWLDLLGLDAGKPYCLQIIAEKLLLGDPKLESRFWKAVLEHEILSDYATTENLVIPAEELLDALPDVAKVVFPGRCLAYACPLLQETEDDTTFFVRQSRAALAAAILECSRVVSDPVLLIQSPRDPCMITEHQEQTQALTVCDETHPMFIRHRSTLDHFLKIDSAEVIMTAVVHHRVDDLRMKLDPILESKLIVAQDYWARILRINVPQRLCSHPLDFTSVCDETGRRKDPKWLIHLFNKFVHPDASRPLFVDIPLLTEFSSLDSRIDQLCLEFDTLLDFMLPVGSTNMTGVAFEEDAGKCARGGKNMQGLLRTVL